MTSWKSGTITCIYLAAEGGRRRVEKPALALLRQGQVLLGRSFWVIYDQLESEFLYLVACLHLLGTITCVYLAADGGRRRVENRSGSVESGTGPTGQQHLGNT